MSSAFAGELDPLECSLPDRPLSSNEETDAPQLLLRFRFSPSLPSSYTSSSPLPACADPDDDCTNFRLHLDWPDSRNPLANGLLSIFSLVMRSFCQHRKKYLVSYCMFVRNYTVSLGFALEATMYARTKWSLQTKCIK